ncbi:unnamed protein product [Urochloa humidicola]
MALQPVRSDDSAELARMADPDERSVAELPRPRRSCNGRANKESRRAPVSSSGWSRRAPRPRRVERRRPATTAAVGGFTWGTRCSRARTVPGREVDHVQLSGIMRTQGN